MRTLTPGGHPDTLGTPSVQSKDQMRKCPFMSRRKKKTLFAQKGYVKRLKYFSF